jgi:type IV pilus assembly protein PilY1
MTKLKLINLSFKIFLLSIFFVVSAQAKSLPPGTGEGDVPSNVLLLLDKSGSMSWCMPGGDYMCMPDDITADADGDLFIIQYPGQGLVKMHYDTLTIDTTFAENGVYDPADEDCKVLSSGIAYGLVEHHVGADGKSYIYSSDFWRQQVVKINADTGECVRKWDIDGHPNGFAIAGDTLFVNKWQWQNGTKKGITSINLTSGAKKSCTAWNFNDNFGIAVDSTKENLYMFDFNTGDQQIRRFAMSDDGGWCPDSTTSTSSWLLNMPGMDDWENNVGLRMDPDNDNVIFIQASWTSKMAKATLNSSKNGFTYDWDIGRFGMNKSTPTNVQFGFPWGLGIDPLNKRLLSAGWYSGFGQVFDYDGNFIKSTEPSVTRMEGAAGAIKSVVSDTSLSNDIDFGFGYWSWKGWNGDIEARVSGWNGTVETGEAIPCNSNNCVKVAISQSGKTRITKIISSVTPQGGTDANTFAELATDYFNSNAVDTNNVKICPMDTSILCQKNYVVVIGDGGFQSGDTEVAKETVKALAARGIITIMVAYGPGLEAAHKVSFNEFAVLGDPEKILSNGATPTALFAKTGPSLKTQLSSLLSGIVAQKFSFTAPAISATIEEGGSLFQATFEYRQNKEWKGTLLRKKIDGNGNIDENDVDNWSFADELPAPEDRKIWTVLANNSPDYTEDYNNFNKDNSVEVGQLFNLTGSMIGDYHRLTGIGGSDRLSRCKDEDGVLDGVADDIKGLIDFTRGTDYFDYAGDCDLTKTRPNPFGEIYHSELIVVGPPNAETSYNSENQEAYWRNYNNYNSFKLDNDNREKVIYVGSNSGALHAIKSSSGEELWAFVPPFIASKFPGMVNTNLNSETGGGTTAIYGVDGSPTVHDMYFIHPMTQTKGWTTILMIPYGRGGAGFSVLDITDPVAPLHLYSVFNDEINKFVHHIDHEGKFSKWGYISPTYTLATFGEAKLASAKYQRDNSADTTCKGDIVQGQLTSTCYKSHTWTFPVDGMTKEDMSIKIGEDDYTGFNLSTNGNTTTISFNDEMVFQANPDAVQDDVTNTTTSLVVTINKNSTITGVTDELKGQFYDYSSLAETWSSPRIIRMPNTDAPDNNIVDDIYVAVMGAGISKANEYVGSSVFVINLEDRINPGKIEKVIPIIDLEGNGVTSSTPATPTVITADTGTSGIRFSGALVYQPDYEGKINKINLTNMKCDNGNLTGTCPQGSMDIKRFDSTVLFNAGANNTNKRFMYHALDATIGSTTSALWLYNSTGDYSRINDITDGVDNLLFGIRDRDFPKFRLIEGDAITDIDDISDCADTTNDSTGEECPTIDRRGWYIQLKDFAKGSAEPTVFAGRVYYPIYQPNLEDRCAIGNAYICAVDDECGTNKSVNELNADSSSANSNKCKFVATGILSRIIVFANKLFANVSGNNADDDDMISINTGVLASESVRDTWRENY